MPRSVRLCITLAALGWALWATFYVRLGARTLAGHLDAIAGTPQAKSLLDETHDAIVPPLRELTGRLAGEYVEAPTAIEDAAHAPSGPPEERTVPTTGPRAREEARPRGPVSGTALVSSAGPMAKGGRAPRPATAEATAHAAASRRAFERAFAPAPEPRVIAPAGSFARGPYEVWRVADPRRARVWPSANSSEPALPSAAQSRAR